MKSPRSRHPAEDVNQERKREDEDTELANKGRRDDFPFGELLITASFLLQPSLEMTPSIWTLWPAGIL